MTELDFDRTARAWLQDGPTELSDRIVQAALDEIHVTRQRRAWWPARRFRSMNSAMKLAIAAAAVVVVAVAAINLLPGDRVGGPIATPTPAPTPTPASFELAGSGALEPGSYELGYIEPLRVTFTVPEGWEKLSVPTTIWGPGSDTRLGFMTVDNVFIDPCASGLGVLDPTVGPTVDDLVAAFGNVPGVQASAPIDVTVDGFAGKQIDLSAPAPWEACEGEGPTLLRANGGRLDIPAPQPNEDTRWWILDVDGHRLVIVQGARPAATAADRAALQAIFESIRIEATAGPGSSIGTGPSANPSP